MLCHGLIFYSYLKNWLVQCTLNFQTQTLAVMQFLKNRQVLKGRGGTPMGVCCREGYGFLAVKNI